MCGCHSRWVIFGWGIVAIFTPKRTFGKYARSQYYISPLSWDKLRGGQQNQGSVSHIVSEERVSALLKMSRRLTGKRASAKARGYQFLRPQEKVLWDQAFPETGVACGTGMKCRGKFSLLLLLPWVIRQGVDLGGYLSVIWQGQHILAPLFFFVPFLKPNISQHINHKVIQSIKKRQVR